MILEKIYVLGETYSFGFATEDSKKRIEYIRYKYSAQAVTSSALLVFFGIILVSLFFSIISTFITSLIFFFGLIISIIIYIYPTYILYTEKMVEYNEQMLRAVMSISNFISMGTSMEYAINKTAPQLRGVLQQEFLEIGSSLHRRVKTTLGDAIMAYVEKWNDVNSVFVKSVRLLQNAAMAEPESREAMIKEITETLMLEFSIKGKRDAENLSERSKGLITFGVLLPVTSLMILPLVSVFLPQLISVQALVFFYNILIPTFIFLAALNFANQRIQVNTIQLEDAESYEPIPYLWYIVGFGVVILFAIPGILHLSTIDTSTLGGAEREYEFLSVVWIWLISVGIMLSIFVISKIYVHKHKKLWEDVKELEDDMPHLLQTFSTLLSLNLSIEKIIPDVVDDYKGQGFKTHPVVRVFTVISRGMHSSKRSLVAMVNTVLRKTCPSKKFSNVFNQIVGFTTISQDSAVKSTKLIRQQIVHIYKLDDYMRTLLSETISLINISINMLLPLLSGIAIIMSLIIVQSLTYITDVLNQIQADLGGSANLSLVDITAVIPPTVLQTIIGFYFIQMFLVLTFFSTKIDVGNDKFSFAKALAGNMTGFVLFSIILLVGHLIMGVYIFGVILT
ncbi:MAG: hypothetical protein ACMXYF_05570 [Candidatus Woesearchaeota archaeon]